MVICFTGKESLNSSTLKYRGTPTIDQTTKNNPIFGLNQYGSSLLRTVEPIATLVHVLITRWHCVNSVIPCHGVMNVTRSGDLINGVLGMQFGFKWKTFAMTEESTDYTMSSSRSRGVNSKRLPVHKQPQQRNAKCIQTKCLHSSIVKTILANTCWSQKILHDVFECPTYHMDGLLFSGGSRGISRNYIVRLLVWIFFFC